MADLEEELRSAGARWRSEQRDPVVDLDRTKVRSRGRRALVSTCVTLIVIVPGIVLVATRANKNPRVNVAPTSSPTTIAPARPDVIPLNSEIVQPDVLAVDGTRLWVTGFAPDRGGVRGPGPAHLQQIDSETGRLLGDLTLPDNAPGGIRVGDGALWVSVNQGEASTEILKVDMARMRIAGRIPGIKDGAVTVTPTVVWATDGVGGLRRIDPATARVVETIGLHANALVPPLLVEAGPLGLFVGNYYSGTIQRIDEATNGVGPEIRVASGFSSMIELNDSLWFTTGTDGRQLVEVENGTKPLRPIDLGERVLDVVTDGSSLWFGTDSSHVVRVDPATGSVTRVELPAGTRATTVAADPLTGAVWATSMFPTPRLLRVPNAAPAPTTTTGCAVCR